jgi:hypothetical protein
LSRAEFWRNRLVSLEPLFCCICRLIFRLSASQAPSFSVTHWQWFTLHLPAVVASFRRNRGIHLFRQIKRAIFYTVCMLQTGVSSGNKWEGATFKSAIK